MSYTACDNLESILTTNPVTPVTYQLDLAGNLVVYDAGLTAKIPVFAPILINNGYPVRLSDDQFQMLEAVRNRMANVSGESLVIKQLQLPLANTEYQFTFPKGTKAFSFKTRDYGLDPRAVILYAYSPGIVATATPDGSGNSFAVLDVETENVEEGLYFCSPQTIYFAASTAAVLLTIQYRL